MQMTTLVSGSVVAIVMVASVGSAYAGGQPDSVDRVAAAQAAPAQSGLASSQFATLGGVKAAPMASRELDAIRGLHLHFLTPSGLHFVNSNNSDHFIDFGTGPAGPGYHGLCGAALRSPALSIPGQNTSTGVGAGC